MEKLLKGTGVSPGLTIGKALKYTIPDINYDRKEITVKEIESEIKKLTIALNKSEEQLIKIQQFAENKIGKNEAEIFEAHIMLLQDKEFINDICVMIRGNLKSAPEAVKLVASELSAVFRGMDDKYLQERAADIEDVSQRIIANILDVEMNPLVTLKEGVVLVAENITPSDLVLIDLEKIKAFIIEKGGPTSHSVIMARSLEIPGVTGCYRIMEKIADGDTIIVDGEKGEVIINPSEKVVQKTEKKLEELRDQQKKLLKIKDLPAVTRDGCCFELMANIGTLQDVESALKYGAEGIGLFRTEFILMGRKQAPSEDEQFAIYKKVGESLKGKPVTIRTFDIGGDKGLKYFQFPVETNPFLGWRGIRFCLDNEDFFKTQLKAILRAANYGNIEIMYPMISVEEDLQKANTILKKAEAELLKEGRPFNSEIRIGVMIETPAAAIIADKLAAEVDFFSIGSNDLIQYTMAADRTNKKTNSYYQPQNTAVLRLLEKVVDNAHQQGIPVGICGEMAADPELTNLLIGLGFNKLSMSPSQLLRIKSNIRKADYTTCREDLKKL